MNEAPGTPGEDATGTTATDPLVAPEEEQGGGVPPPGRAPLIGLTGRTRTFADMAGTAASLADRPLEMFVRDYSRQVAEAGGVPVQIAFDAPAGAIVSRLDGLVLTGGADVEPSRYGQGPDPELGRVETDRDSYELALLEAALEIGIPVLGICRGAQVLNVFLGGTLEQHVPTHSRYDVDPSAHVHEVEIEPGSLAARVYGSTVGVNSLHHQTISELGRGLRVTGRAPDGTVEVIEWPRRPVLAVQWHPEMLPGRDPSFRWLTEAARAAMGGQGRA